MASCAQYALGFDFGTTSCRVLCVNIKDGSIVGDDALEYPSGVIEKSLPGSGALLPDGWYLQDPDDYLFVFRELTRSVLRQSGIDASLVRAVGFSFTNCTMLPVDGQGEALCRFPELRNNPHAWVKLWKHHASEPQARLILEKAREAGAPWLKYYGNSVSAEWLFPKILQIYFEAPDIYARADRFVEAADWIVERLTGNPTRNSATLGVNAFRQEPEGFPSADFWCGIHPGLNDLVSAKLRGEVLPVGSPAGILLPETAAELDLSNDVVVAVGHGDSEVTACGLGIVEPEVMICVLGTSTCCQYMSRRCVPFDGICSVAKDGMVPGYYAYEAGQPAVGDIFAWFVDNAMPHRYFEEAQKRGINPHMLLSEKASRLRPGQSGLVALDWLNGNRSTLMNYDLTGMLMGLTLRTTPEEIYRAFVEATAFGMKKIQDTFVRNGLPVKDIVATGGLAARNPFLVQLYSDVLGMPIRVPHGVNASALGAAVCGAVALGPQRGGYADFAGAVARMVPKNEVLYRHDADNHRTYMKLYGVYEELYASMGATRESVMQRLRSVRDTIREEG